MASNETSKYKLSVIEGTELQLSINAGPQGPAGPVGPAGQNEITTATSTNLIGFISGNGTSISSTVGTTSPTADTIALRNTTGGISAKHIRLHGDTYYAQINPTSTGQTQDISLNLPTSTGTIATNNTAVMLTGVQTVAGAKTFSGQMELTGQLASSSTSVMTRSLGDYRYSQKLKVAYSADPLVGPINSTALTLITSLYLETGAYHIEVAAATFTPTGTPANTTIRLSTSTEGDAAYHGFDDYGSTTYTHIDVETDPIPAAFIRQSSGTASTFFRNLRGIITVKQNTSLNLEFRQSTPSQNVITCRNGAYIIARKIA